MTVIRGILERKEYDATTTLFIGICQRTLGHVAASYAQMIELGLVDTQTDIDIVQALTASYLRENHVKNLIGVRKSLGGLFGEVALLTTTKCAKGKMLHELHKYQLA